MAIINGVQFAKMAGDINKSTISRARDAGTIIPDAQGNYDTTNQSNAEYIVRQLNRQKNKLERTKKAKVKAKKKPLPKKQEPIKKVVARQPVRSSSNLTKIEAEIMLKEIQIEKGKVDLDIALGKIIPRDEIQYIWNKLYNARSYFADFGQRYASDFAAALGVSDAKKISTLEAQIDKATERWFNDFCNQIEGEL